jgi:hypothetical protein
MLKPFTSKIPVLAISGVRDPVTPPDAANEALRMFGRHVHIRIDAGFHTNSNSRCISERIAEFLKNPQQQLTGLDCVNRFPRPRFMLSPTL